MGVSSSRLRRRCPPGLPKLDELSSDQASAAANSDSLFALLRRTALNHQRDDFQPFYSIRAIAEHFHIPPATVCRLYRRLSTEGLLRFMWGSKTVLEPIHSSKKKKTQIGIAVDLRRFKSSSDYSDHILELQNAVSHVRIVERLIFFRDADEVARVLRQKHADRVRAVIWPFPGIDHYSSILQLQDLGLRVICLGGDQTRVIRDCYPVGCRGGLRRIVHERVLRMI